MGRPIGPATFPRPDHAVSDVFLARQPIYNRDLKLEAYELLYRHTPTATVAEGADTVTMSSTTLVNGVLNFGLESLTGGARAFVNFPREMLIERDFDLLDPRTVTIELLETVPCDDDTVGACRELRDRGFTLALDDFVAGDEYGRILELAHIVKLDVLGKSEAELTRTVARFAAYDVKLLAERIETATTFATCSRLGFSYFQGFYFSRPEIVKRRALSPGLSGIARLMNQVLDPAVPERTLEDSFRADPALTIKLLRIVNSAAMGRSGIDSIPQAIRLVGRAPLHRWLALLLASSAPRGDGIESEMVLAALERGRLCEVMAENSGRKAAAPALFLTGLLSTLDSILGVPMAELLKQIKVSVEVETALLHEEGPYTPFLQLATSYANGEWEPAMQLAEMMGVLADLPRWYRESSDWAREVLKAA
ncbi:MAG: EAL domain-containing protein [Gemmatimonadetes bacterium]|nr:EAL domain-containing protein [Gemmatimonadota bacterium]